MIKSRYPAHPENPVYPDSDNCATPHPHEIFGKQVTFSVISGRGAGGRWGAGTQLDRIAKIARNDDNACLPPAACSP
jgi:hypothetical protein